MKFLICPNKFENPYVSALSDEMLRTLSEQYDIVVNESVQVDLQEESEVYWCHLAIVNEALADCVRSLLSWHGLTHNDMVPNCYSWQKNRVAIEVWGKANDIAVILKKPYTEIIVYEGPSGHPGVAPKKVEGTFSCQICGTTTPLPHICPAFYPKLPKTPT